MQKKSGKWAVLLFVFFLVFAFVIWPLGMIEVFRCYGVTFTYKEGKVETCLKGKPTTVQSQEPGATEGPSDNTGGGDMGEK